MITSVEQYLVELKAQLSGSDRATVQDAVFLMPKEYLRTALGNMASGESATPAESLQTVIIKYGTPAEIAAAYRQLKLSTAPALGLPRVLSNRKSLLCPRSEKGCETARSTCVSSESSPRPGPGGPLFYLVFALATGIIYFTWAVTGLSVSLSLLIHHRSAVVVVSPLDSRHSPRGGPYGRSLAGSQDAPTGPVHRKEDGRVATF